jgi:hypothetical protein
MLLRRLLERSFVARMRETTATERLVAGAVGDVAETD